MKFFSILTVLLVCSCCLFAQEIRNIGDEYRVVYHVVDEEYRHVTGQAISLQIQKLSTGDFFDFSDDTFKPAGWVLKSVELTEDSTIGLYYYRFVQPVSETLPEQYLFVVDNSDATYADHQTEVVFYTNFGTWNSSEKNTVLDRIELIRP